MAGTFWLFALSVLYLISFVQGCPGPDSARTITFPPGFFRNDTLHHKRWAGIRPGDGAGLLALTTNTNAKTWPQGVIRTCIDSSLIGNMRIEAMDAILNGMEVWYTAGLPRRAWRVQILTPAQCSTQGVTGPKANFLWVRWAGRTPTGAWVYPRASLGNTNSGSIFSFQTREYIADITQSGATALAQQLNFDYTHAHEVGHVFGLVHEHQHPVAWPVYHGGVHPRNGLIDFFCENLWDYDTCLAQRTAFLGGDAQKARDDLTHLLCAEQLDALSQLCQGGQPAGDVYDPSRGDHILSSYEFLPYPGGSSFIQHSESTVDWRSIMMYSSHSAAKAFGMPVFVIRSDEDQQGSPGTDPANPQYVQPGLDGVFGTTINRPTTHDIFGAYQMSEAVLPTDVDGLPYFSPGSPFNSVWATEQKGRRVDICVIT